MATVREWQEHPGCAGIWRGPPDTSLQILDRSQQLCDEGCIGSLQPVPPAAEEGVEHGELRTDLMLGYTGTDGQVYPLGLSGLAQATEDGWLTPYEGEQLLETHPDVAEAVMWHSDMTLDRPLDAPLQDTVDAKPEVDGFRAFVAVSYTHLTLPTTPYV